MEVPVSIEGESETWPLWYMDGNVLRILTHSLSEKKSGRQATFIATNHIGKKSYYSAIEQKFQELPGLILQEKGNIEGEKKTRKEKIFYEQFWGAHQSVVATGQALGLDVCYQRATLQYPEERTRNVDISFAEWIEELESRKFDIYCLENILDCSKWFRDGIEYIDVIDDREKKELMRLVENWVVEGITSEPTPPSAYMEARNRPLDEVSFEVRESRVLAEINNTSENVIVPWGASHIGRLSNSLRAQHEWVLNESSVHYDVVYECVT